MRRHLLRFSVGINILFVATSIFAVNLVEIYREAVVNDPVLQEAFYTRLSTEQVLPQARSELLPFLLGIADVARAHTKQSRDATTLGGALTGERLRIDGTFNDQFYSVSLRQPVFNYAAWKQVQSAKSTVKQAEAIFNEAAQDLILRVAQAYFDVLEAEDILRFTRAEKRASARRLEEARERYNVGLDPITTVYEAQANYDDIVASEIAAENEVINSKEAIRLLVGRTYKNFAALKQEAPLLPPTPDNVKQWEQSAIKQNYQLLADRFASEAALENISAQRAGNYPTVDFVGSYDVVEGSNPTFIGSLQGFNQKNAEASLVIEFPVFQGGLVAANTRQARYDYENALAIVENTYRNTIVTARQSFNDVISGISKVKADRQAIISGENFLESIEAQFRVGTRTMLDVLDAQRNLYDQQRNHSIDQYAYILATLQLKFAAAILNITDLENINGWLHDIDEPEEALD